MSADDVLRKFQELGSRRPAAEQGQRDERGRWYWLLPRCGSGTVYETLEQAQAAAPIGREIMSADYLPRWCTCIIDSHGRRREMTADEADEVARKVIERAEILIEQLLARD